MITEKKQYLVLSGQDVGGVSQKEMNLLYPSSGGGL
jgi:hypothetical protein